MPSDLDQSLSNAIASGVSAPVDLITWLLRKGGLPIEKPVMGSDWMREKGLTKDVQPGAAQVVGETVGNLVDPIGSIAPAAKGAMLIGTHFPDPQVSKVIDLLRKGATTEEAWQDTGRAIVPTHTNALKPRLDDPFKLSFVKEISDAGYKPNKTLQLTPTEKQNLVKKLDPIRQASAALRAQSTDLFLPGRFVLDDLIEHPELFKEGSDLKGMKVHIDPKETGFGSYSPSARTITLGIKPFLENPGRGHMSTLIHELMHDQQRVFDMPRGANVKMTTLTGPERDALKEYYNQYAYNSKQFSDEDKYNMYNIVRNMHAPYNLYKNILGEQQARAAQTRLGMTEAEREAISPTASYDDLANGVHPAYLAQLLQQLRGQPSVP